MYKWKDYSENSALFIDDISTNVAILRHKDFQLHDAATGTKIKIKADGLNNAKEESVKYLKEYWNNIKRDIDRQLMAIQEDKNV